MKRMVFILAFVFGVFFVSQAKDINIQLDSPYFGNSTTTNVSNFLGKKPVLLIFFYPDCPPCEKEASIINKLYSEYKCKVNIVGISLSRDRYDIGDFIRDLKIEYPIWRIHSKDQLKYVGGILATPTIVILDKNGDIVAKCVGNRSYNFLKKQFDNLLKGEVKQCTK